MVKIFWNYNICGCIKNVSDCQQRVMFQIGTFPEAQNIRISLSIDFSQVSDMLICNFIKNALLKSINKTQNRIAPQASGLMRDFRDSQGNPSGINIPSGGTGRIYVNDGSANGITIWSFP